MFTGFAALENYKVVVKISALEPGSGCRIGVAGLDAEAFQQFGLPTCFARCLSRLLKLLVNLLLVGHVFIRLSL
jgi:hypothetical protein